MRTKNSPIKKTQPVPDMTKKTNKQNMKSLFGESLTWGTGMGIGSEIGHSMFKTTTTVQKSHDDICQDIKKLYDTCLTNNSFDNTKCEFIQMEMEKFCKS